MRSIFFLFCLIFMIGCGDSVDSSVISSGAKNTKEQLEASNNIDKNSYMEVSDVFLDTQKIKTNDNRPYLIIFAANGCIYCDKLKELVKNEQEVKDTLKSYFSPYYVNLSYSKMHDVEFLQQKISTADFGKMYQIMPTPTMVFLDNAGKVLFVYPGYMPKDKFMVTLNYIKDSTDKSEEDIKLELQKKFEEMGV